MKQRRANSGRANERGRRKIITNEAKINSKLTRELLFAPHMQPWETLLTGFNSAALNPGMNTACENLIVRFGGRELLIEAAIFDLDGTLVDTCSA